MIDELFSKEPKAFTCPNCGGNGKQMNGFYDQVGGLWTSSNTSFIKCRSCNGKGVVFN